MGDEDALAAEILEKLGHVYGMGCTSIVVANTTGHVTHGRNLDWTNAPLYSPLVTELTYTRGGEVVAMTTSFFPEISPTTLYSPKVSFSYNARTAEMQANATTALTCLINASYPLEPFGLQIRKAAFEGRNYSEVFYAVATNKFCAPAYIVISGPGAYEGALLTTSIVEKPRVRALGQPYTEEGDPRQPWFVVVSNNDIEFSKLDEWSDRYKYTLELVINASQDLLTNSLDEIEENVLNVTGVRRDTGNSCTCYMGLMDTQNKKYKIVVRSLTVSENQFYQNTTIPPEPEDPVSSSAKTSSKKQSSAAPAPATSSAKSGSAQYSFLSVMYVVVALCVAFFSRI